MRNNLIDSPKSDKFNNSLKDILPRNCTNATK